MVTNPYYFFRTGVGNGLGGSGGCIMKETEPVPATHGGLEEGTVINNMNPCDVLKMVLFPYQYPSFTSFQIKNQTTLLEIGDKIQGGVRTFEWSTKNSDNIKPNSISIKDMNTNTVLKDNLENDGSEDIDIGSDKQETSPNATYKWRISGVNSKGQTFTRDFTVVWRARVYWGLTTNENPTESEIKNAQNSALKANYKGTYNFSNQGQPVYYYIAYPASWGNISSWKDTDSGFEVDKTYANNVNITNSFGVTVEYKVLRTTYKQTADLHSNVS